jgi:creatinine amidohydrolase
MRLATMTWRETEAYLAARADLVLPIGSTEQHGPTGLLGTDWLTADAIAQGIGQKLGVAVAPPVTYGVASHHMAFAGTATLRPSTFQAVLRELLHSFYRHGFRHFFLVNGHGGNEPSVRATFQEAKHDGFEGATFQLYNWWKTEAVTQLARELYGDREGFHATPSEVSLTFHLERLAPRAYRFEPRPQSTPWPLSDAEVRRAFPDGTMASDPGLASAEHGARFLEAAVDGIAASIARAPRLG